MSLTTTDRNIHAFRRRVNLKAISPSAVKKLSERVSSHVDYLIQSIERSIEPKRGKWGQGQDMANLLAYCIFDIMADATFSQHWSLQREEKYRRFAHSLPKAVAGIHLTGHMQWLYTFGLHRIFFRELIVGVEQFMGLSRTFARNRLADGNISRGDIWDALLAARDPKTGRGFTEEELTSEASLFIIGGTDGMITCATSTLFYLLHNPATLPYPSFRR